jgi:hypothetical protein
MYLDLNIQCMLLGDKIQSYPVKICFATLIILLGDLVTKGQRNGSCWERTVGVLSDGKELFANRNAGPVGKASPTAMCC